MQPTRAPPAFPQPVCLSTSISLSTGTFTIRTPQDSPDARHIIQRAHAGSAADKLHVLILGAASNPASALLLDPTIADKVIFKSSLEYYHMPAPSVSGDLVMTRSDVQQHLAGRGALGDFLVEYWEKNPRYGKIERTRIWDVALVQAFLHPQLAQRTITGAPIVQTMAKERSTEQSSLRRDDSIAGQPVREGRQKCWSHRSVKSPESYKGMFFRCQNSRKYASEQSSPEPDEHDSAKKM
jgi:hypothetical protein